MRYRPKAARRRRKSALPESSERSERNRRIMTSNYDNPLVDGRGGRGAHADPLDG
jgi:hypothetical protein